MDNELLKSNITIRPAPASKPAAGLAAEPPLLFFELNSDELNVLGEFHDFIMLIINDAKSRLHEKSSSLEIAAWVDVKLSTPGLKLPSRLAALNSESLRQGLIEEIQSYFSNKALISSIQGQILTAFNEIIDNNPYGQTEELIMMLDGFISSIDVLITQNESKLTDVQKYEIWSYKDELTKINRLIDTNGADDYDTLIAMSRLRKKLGAK